MGAVEVVRVTPLVEVKPLSNPFVVFLRTMFVCCLLALLPVWASAADRPRASVPT